MRRLIGLAVVLAVATSDAVGQHLLWDNNIKTNGRSGRPISPPMFPNWRVADDFVVRNGSFWWIARVFYSAIEDPTWVWDDGDGIEMFVYEDTDGNGPGKIIATRTAGGSKVATGNTYFGRAEYRYRAELGDFVKLGPGTYWVGVRHPTAGGTGTNWWMTSDGGRDGKRSSTGYFSLDSGNTWEPGGDIWHHAFEMRGEDIPEPTTLTVWSLLAALGMTCGWWRRRAA